MQANTEEVEPPAYVSLNTRHTMRGACRQNGRVGGWVGGGSGRGKKWGRAVSVCRQEGRTAAGLVPSPPSRPAARPHVVRQARDAEGVVGAGCHEASNHGAVPDPVGKAGRREEVEQGVVRFWQGMHWHGRHWQGMREAGGGAGHCCQRLDLLLPLQKHLPSGLAPPTPAKPKALLPTHRTCQRSR